jgi:alpha-beta hydrolase superfamily lysophospholipase
MYEEIDADRRRFLNIAAVALGGVGLRVATAVTAPPPGMNTLGELKQIDAGLLNIGYAELGPPRGRVVILLHGWPYDIHSYVDVAPLLVSAKYRVIVPYLRGYGTTRFLSRDTFRNGQQSALAADVIALADPAPRVREARRRRWRGPGLLSALQPPPASEPPHLR